MKRVKGLNLVLSQSHISLKIFSVGTWNFCDDIRFLFKCLVSIVGVYYELTLLQFQDSEGTWNLCDYIDFCSNALSVWVNLVTISGFREKVFAFVGFKVYAAGLYVNPSIISNLNSWKGRSSAEIQEDSSLFSSIFQGKRNWMFCSFECLIGKEKLLTYISFL